MGTDLKYKAGKIIVGGELESIGYCWRIGANERSLVIRRESGEVVTLDGYPPGQRNTHTETLDNIQTWASLKTSREKHEFHRKFKGT